LINAVGLEVFSGLPVTDNIANYFSHLSNQTVSGVLSVRATWAAVFATEIAIVWNFMMNNMWTFSQERITRPIKLIYKFLQFNLTSVGAIIIQAIIIGAAAKFFGDTRLVRQVALIIAVGFFVVPYNYTMYNVFIWKRWRVPGLGFIQDKSISGHVKKNYLK
jgi:putative flippase GtrA